MKYGKRSGWKRFFSSTLALIGAFVLFVFLAHATWGVYQKSRQSGDKLSEAQAEYDKLQTHQRDLSDKVSYLSTDEGKEAEMRTKYRAIKEGESVAVILDDQAAAAVTATSTESVGWFRSLLKKLGL